MQTFYEHGVLCHQASMILKVRAPTHSTFLFTTITPEMMTVLSQPPYLSDLAPVDFQQ